MRPITLVVLAAGGGAIGVLVRRIAAPTSANLEQHVVVGNRAGAGAILDMQSVVGAPLDRHTLSIGNITAKAITNSANKRLRNDNTNAFQEVSRIAVMPKVLVVTPTIPAKMVRNFIA